MQETQERQVWPLGLEDPLEKKMATHFSILAWKIPWTEEPGGLQSMGSQRVRHDWVTGHTFCFISGWIFFFFFNAAETFFTKHPTYFPAEWTLFILSGKIVRLPTVQETLTLPSYFLKPIYVSLAWCYNYVMKLNITESVRIWMQKSHFSKIPLKKSLKKLFVFQFRKLCKDWIDKELLKIAARVVVGETSVNHGKKHLTI